MKTTAGFNWLLFAQLVLNEIIIPLHGTRSSNTARTWLANSGTACRRKNQSAFNIINGQEGVKLNLGILSRA